MASNSRSESAPSPVAAQQQDSTTTLKGKGVTIDRTSKIQSDEPVTVTTTTSHGYNDIIPTLLPALQSSSYILVIMAAFLAWSSRKLVRDFMHGHIALVSSVKENLDQQLIVSQKQADELKNIAEHNGNLTEAIRKLADNNSRALDGIVDFARHGSSK